MSLLTLIMMTIISSCDRFGWKDRIYDTSPDSSFVVQTVKATINPHFTSYLEVKEYQTRSIELFSMDETFRNIPEETLRNITSVCLKKDTYITKQDIVNEYLSNRGVYDNLPPPIVQESAKEIVQSNDESKAIDKERHPRASEEYRLYRVDTIEGKATELYIKYTK